MNQTSNALDADEYIRVKQYIINTDFKISSHTREEFLIRSLVYFYKNKSSNQMNSMEKLKFIFLDFYKGKNIDKRVDDILKKMIKKSTYYNGYKIDFYKERDKKRNTNTLKTRNSIYVFVIEPISNTVLTLDIRHGREVSKWVYTERYTKKELKLLIDSDLSKEKDLFSKWLVQPLDAVYSFILCNTFQVKVSNEDCVNKTCYMLFGIDMLGNKKCLSIYIDEYEKVRNSFWLKIFTDLHNRGIKDILCISTNEKIYFSKILKSIYPNTIIQPCIISLMQQSLEYVSIEDKEFLEKDLKKIFKNNSKKVSILLYSQAKEKWNEKYPYIFNLLYANRHNILNYFNYPEEIRRVIYTSNIIELIHKQYKSLIGTPYTFQNGEELNHLLYMGIKKTEKKWTKPIKNWNFTISKLNL